MTIRQNICRLAVAAAMLGGAIAYAPASVDAQSNDLMQMMGRLRQLENQVQTLSRSVYRGETPPASATNYAASTPTAGLAGFEVRLSQMEGELRKITGRLEQQDHEIAQLKSRFDRAMADMEMRLSSGASNRVMPNQYPAQMQTSGRPQMAPPTQPVDSGLSRSDHAEPQIIPQNGQIVVSSKGSSLEYQSNTVRPLGQIKKEEIAPPGQTAVKAVNNAVGVHNENISPEKLYEKAFLMVREANYARAEEHFTVFLTEYPKHKFAPNAQYWLSETYYVRGNFQQAAQMFAKGYQSYPKSNKTADNLLKLALSLEKLGKTQDACLTFKQLDKELSTADTPVKRRADKEKERLGCTS